MATNDPLSALTTLKPTHTSKTAKTGGVRNRAASNVQVTVEQILREAVEQQGVAQISEALDAFADEEEVAMYKGEKRRRFEDMVSLAPGRTTNYTRYAAWEESVGEFERARNVYERGVTANYTDDVLWFKYAELEMRAGHINSARNVLVRAVSVLPRIDKFWFKFAAMEETVGNVAGARTVYNKWMAWTPPPPAWAAYIAFEKRYEEWENVRAIYAKYTSSLADQGLTSQLASAWRKHARFEESLGEIGRARAVYEAALDALDATAALDVPDAAATFLLAFAAFEERAKEYERARVIYSYALQRVEGSTDAAAQIEAASLAFEKRHGSKKNIQSALLVQQREAYDASLAEDPSDYDLWVEYVKMESENGDPSSVREVFERAIGAAPDPALLQADGAALTSLEKNTLESYGYIFIRYAVFEELVGGDLDRAGAIYEMALGLFVGPHLEVVETLYILCASLHLRKKDLARARKILGLGLGRSPSPGLYQFYIQLEHDLLNLDATRTLYNKYLEANPGSVEVWKKYAAFESELDEVERARALYELAIARTTELDQPEVLWKAYIDFEISQGESANAIKLFERLLDFSDHIKVYATYAKYLVTLGAIDDARAVYARGFQAAADAQNTPHRLAGLRAWHAFEQEHGSDEDQAKVVALLPRRVKRRRRVVDAQGRDMGWEEYYDYVWKEEDVRKDKAAANLAFLEKARAWAAARAAPAPAPAAAPAAGVLPAPVPAPMSTAPMSTAPMSTAPASSASPTPMTTSTTTSSTSTSSTAAPSTSSTSSTSTSTSSTS